MSAKIKVPKKRKGVTFAEPQPEPEPENVSSEDEDFDFAPQLPPGLLDDLTEVTDLSKPVVAEEILDNDAEVWILQCPSDVDLKEVLRGKKMYLDGRCDLAQDDTKCPYETLGFPCVPNPGEKPPSVAALLPSEEGGIKLVSKVLKGHIAVRQRIEEKMIPKIEAPQKKKHKIPKLLKARHPLYGLDLPKILDQRGVGASKRKRSKRKDKDAEEAIQCLSDDSIEEKVVVTDQFPVKRKSKKNKLKVEEPDVTYEEVTIETKRKKKDKRDREVGAKLKEQNSIIEDEDPPVKIKKEKKSKYDPEVHTEVNVVEKSRKSKKSKSRD